MNWLPSLQKYKLAIPILVIHDGDFLFKGNASFCEPGGIDKKKVKSYYNTHRGICIIFSIQLR